MRHPHGILRTVALAAGAVLMAHLPAARGLDIQLTFSSNDTWPQAAKDAAERAAADWEFYLTDAITVPVLLDFDDLGSAGVIAAAVPFPESFSFATVRNAMVRDAANEGGDDTIVKSLSSVASNQFVLPAGLSTSGSMVTTRAHAKALGLPVTLPSHAALDPIALNSNPSFIGFDFDGSQPTKVDFESVVRHELGHILGFLSAVDSAKNATAPATISPRPLDLFRFNPSANPKTVTQFTTFKRSLEPGVAGRFNDLMSNWEMSDAELYGGSHWADGGTGSPIGLMDPTLAVGEVSQILRPDLRALDLIGYEVVTLLRLRGVLTAGRIPEPGSLTLLALGGCVLAAAGRVRRG